MQTEYEQNFLVVNTSERGKNINNSYVIKKDYPVQVNIKIEHNLLKRVKK